ncbi:MAG: MFS transporter [Firmicutes bacterium]|nr:MFS transporter [Bacillota bacterium]MCL5038421.1 MFS transporter [Bacillota bacterium]
MTNSDRPGGAKDGDGLNQTPKMNTPKMNRDQPVRFWAAIGEKLGLFNYLPPDPVLRANARNSLIDGMAYAVMVGFFNPFVSVFAMALGATNYMVGLLNSLPAFTTVLAQLLGAYITNRFPSRVRVALWATFLHRITFLLLTCLPFLPVNRAWVLIFTVILANLPAGVAGLAWTTLMGELFPLEYRGKVFGERNAYVGAVTLLATALGGVVLGKIAFPYNFAWLNGLSFFFLMVSFHFLSRLQENPAPDRVGLLDKVEGLDRPSFEKRLSHRGPGTFLFRLRSTLWALFKRPLLALRRWRQVAPKVGTRGGDIWSFPASFLGLKPYREFLLSLLVFQFGLQLLAGVYPILFIRILKFSPGWIGFFATAAGLSSVLTYHFWGHLGDRRGHGFVLAIVTWAFPLSSLAYVYVTQPYTPVFLEFLFGLFASGFNLGVFNYLLEITPERGRPSYLAFFNVAMNLVLFVAPIIGVWLLTVSGVTTVLILASGIRALGAFLVGRSIWGRQPGTL